MCHYEFVTVQSIHMSQLVTSRLILTVPTRLLITLIGDNANFIIVILLPVDIKNLSDNHFLIISFHSLVCPTDFRSLLFT